jgi:hypothetical protein
MKTASFFSPILAVLMFLAGIAFQLILSSSLVWAQLEASIFGTQTADADLGIQCPVILAESESGLVSTAVTNSLDRDVLPVVTAEVSRGAGMQSLNETLSLAPHETRQVQWRVDAANVIFGRLILVSVVQRRYSDLESRQGACGILVFSLFNLSGAAALGLMFFGSLGLILTGGLLWWRRYAPLDDRAESTFRACSTLAGVVTVASLAALPRWWGLTILLNVVALIMLVVIFTELKLFPRRPRS